MVQRGIVKNGVIVPDSPPLPEGTRVLINEEEVYEYPHPLAPYDREKEIELLREELARIEAGDCGRPHERSLR
jgi:hypothetical protein